MGCSVVGGTVGPDSIGGAVRGNVSEGEKAVSAGCRTSFSTLEGIHSRHSWKALPYPDPYSSGLGSTVHVRQRGLADVIETVADGPSSCARHSRHNGRSFGMLGMPEIAGVDNPVDGIEPRRKREMMLIFQTTDFMTIRSRNDLDHNRPTLIRTVPKIGTFPMRMGSIPFTLTCLSTRTLDAVDRNQNRCG